MTRIRFAYANLWKKYAIIARTSEHPQFPAEETQNDSRQFFWRSKYVSAGGTRTQNIDIDLGTAQEYNFVAVFDHNITSGNTEWKIYGADDSGFSTNVVSDTITWYAGSAFVFLGTARTKRYIRIKVIDSSNPADYLQMGMIVVAKYFEPNRNFVKGYQDGYEDFSELEFSDSMMMSALARPKPRAFELPFEGVDDASATGFVSLLNECGQGAPFIICRDYNNPNTNSFLVRLDGLNYPQNTGPNRWNWDASLKEVL